MRAHSADIENRVVESIYIGIYPGIGDPQDEMFKLSMNITWSVCFSNITLLYRLGITFRYIIRPDKHDNRELFTKTSKFLIWQWGYWWMGDGKGWLGGFKLYYMRGKWDYLNHGARLLRMSLTWYLYQNINIENHLYSLGLNKMTKRDNKIRQIKITN